MFIFLLLQSGREVSSITLTFLKITNGLDHYNNLTLHCLCPAKNSDTGFRSLLPGQDFSFLFQPGDDGNTIWFCNFAWPGSRHYYDVYVPTRDVDCRQCLWMVSDPGPCRFDNVTQSYTICYPWNN
ncbi:hypothetical protein BT93_B1595 [Corymbia citriodora subsp. variegata]|nr:hypothetical protein BT93_B1595 [Corymbia citriodora subsp. variegata]